METKRKFWIDNLRWVTVLSVLLYHVIYFYNNKGVFGGVGGFGDGPQYQDVLMYILYPWFMPLLFILAGISSRYALENRDGKTWFKSRTRKLLVPATRAISSRIMSIVFRRATISTPSALQVKC